MQEEVIHWPNWQADEGFVRYNDCPPTFAHPAYYVREGVTRNLYERWAMGRAVPDAKFELTDASVKDDYQLLWSPFYLSKDRRILSE